MAQELSLTELKEQNIALNKELNETRSRLQIESSKRELFENELQDVQKKLEEVDVNLQKTTRHLEQVKTAYISKAKEAEKLKEDKDQCLIISLALTFLLLMLVAFTIANQ